MPETRNGSWRKLLVWFKKDTVTRLDARKSAERSTRPKISRAELIREYVDAALLKPVAAAKPDVSQTRPSNGAMKTTSGAAALAARTGKRPMRAEIRK